MQRRSYIGSELGGGAHLEITIDMTRSRNLGTSPKMLRLDMPFDRLLMAATVWRRLRLIEPKFRRIGDLTLAELELGRAPLRGLHPSGAKMP